MSSRVTRGSIARAAKILNETTSKKKNVPQHLSGPLVITGGPKKTRNLPATKNLVSATQADLHEKPEAEASLTPVTNAKKRKRAVAPKVEEDPDELPHNLGKAFAAKSEDVQGAKDEDHGEPSYKKQATRDKVVKAEEFKELNETMKTATAEMQEDSSTKKPRKRKTNAYGLTPGVSPFPDWPHPTPEECQEVVDLLSKVHGPQIAPATIPAPSLTVSGCGEVPSILDAMIRTLLSAATTGTNSSRAFQGLVDKFGILKEGIGKGSIDWDAVRRAEQLDIFEAIKSGGLAANKSKNIKAILEKVYEENMARRDAILKAQKGDDATLAPKGADNESPEEQHVEIVRADQHVLSLDHLHALPTHDAMEAMMQYPGIGVKTSSCVALFCMRRPSLAVDTHVFRLLKWLHWVPPTVKGEIAAFSHVEVRVPDGLKYALHQLFLKHGKTCPRCRAATGETSEDWGKGCIIDHLVTRTGKRKGGAGPVVVTKPKAGKHGTKKAKGKGKMREETDESDLSSDLTELDTETENEDAEEEIDSVVEKASEAGKANAKTVKAKIVTAKKASAKLKSGKTQKEAELTNADVDIDHVDEARDDSRATNKAAAGEKAATKKPTTKTTKGRTPPEIELTAADDDDDDDDDLTELDIETEKEDSPPPIKKTTKGGRAMAKREKKL